MLGFVLLCVNTYFDTICVHLIKICVQANSTWYLSFYSLLQ